MVCHSGRRGSNSAKQPHKIQNTVKISNLAALGLLAFAEVLFFLSCFYHTLFSNLLSSILATSSLKSNQCELGFFCQLIGTDRSRAGEAALNSAWMLRVEYGERILASQHIFFKNAFILLLLLSEEETYVNTSVQR